MPIAHLTKVGTWQASNPPELATSDCHPGEIRVCCRMRARSRVDVWHGSALLASALFLTAPPQANSRSSWDARTVGAGEPNAIEPGTTWDTPVVVLVHRRFQAAALMDSLGGAAMLKLKVAVAF